MRSTPMSGFLLEDLLNQLKHNPQRAIDQCKQQFQASANTHNQALYDTIAFITAFVVQLRGDERSRNDFMKHEYWAGKPHSPKEKNLDRLATMFVLGAKESKGALYKQALEYEKVVTYFVKSKYEFEDIPQVLKRKPISTLLDELEKAAKANVQGTEAGNADRGTVEGGLGDTDQRAGDENERTHPRRMAIFDEAKHIAVGGRLFNERCRTLQINETLWVRIKRSDDEDGVFRIQVIDIDEKNVDAS